MHLVYFVSLVLVLAASIELILHLICFKPIVRPVLIVVLVLSSMASFFMDTYGTVFDSSMLDNILQTSAREAGSLLNIKLLAYVLLLGVLPSIFIYRARIRYSPLKGELLDSIKIIAIAFVIVLVQGMMFSSFYSSFIRAHKEIRVYANPSMYIYSFFHYAFMNTGQENSKVAVIGEL